MKRQFKKTPQSVKCSSTNAELYTFKIGYEDNNIDRAVQIGGPSGGVETLRAVADNRDDAERYVLKAWGRPYEWIKLISVDPYDGVDEEYEYSLEDEYFPSGVTCSCKICDLNSPSQDCLDEFDNVEDAIDYAKAMYSNIDCGVFDDNGNLIWSSLRYAYDRPQGIAASESVSDDYLIEFHYPDAVEFDTAPTEQEARDLAERRFRKDDELEAVIVKDPADEIILHLKTYGVTIESATSGPRYLLTIYFPDRVETDGMYNKVEVAEWIEDYLKDGATRVVVTNRNGKVIADTAASNRDEDGYEDYEIWQNMWGMEGKYCNEIYRARSSKEAVDMYVAETGDGVSGLFGRPVGTLPVSGEEFDAYYDDLHPSRPIELATQLDDNGGWVVFATDPEGNKYVEGIYESQGYASYWAAMARNADIEYGYGEFDYSIEYIEDTSDSWYYESERELSRIRLGNAHKNRDDANSAKCIECADSTMDRITYLQNRISSIQEELANESDLDGERSVDLQIELSELKEQLNFAWQDDEREYNEAYERQEFNPDGSLKYYGHVNECTGIDIESASSIGYEEQCKLIAVSDGGLHEEELPQVYNSYDEAERAGKQIIENMNSDVEYLEIIEIEFPGHVAGYVYRAEDEPDEDLLYDSFGGKKYLVYGNKSNSYGEIVDSYRPVKTDDPKIALEAWFMLAGRYPMEAAVFAKTKADVVALCKAASSEFLHELAIKYPNNPYDLQYLIDGAAKEVAQNGQGFLESDFGDQVYPFCYG